MRRRDDDDDDENEFCRVGGTRTAHRQTGVLRRNDREASQDDREIGRRRKFIVLFLGFIIVGVINDGVVFFPLRRFLFLRRSGRRPPEGGNESLHGGY